MPARSFDFDIPVVLFEKSDAPVGEQRRIAGAITDGGEDQQGEEIFQRGLDFDYFLRNGWFNDDHDRDHKGVVGYPESLQPFAGGDVLPDGNVAQYDGFWVEGYMLQNYPPADKLWALGKALQGTKRSLSFSVEGDIHARSGPKTIRKIDPNGRPYFVGKKIVKASVRNVAITTKPVNDRSRLHLLSKSLTEVQDELDRELDLESRIEALERALSVGPPTPEGKHRVPNGPQTGEGAGAIVVGQSLEHDDKKDLTRGVPAPPKVEEEPEESDDDDAEDLDEDEEEETKGYGDNLTKYLTESESIDRVRERFPHMTEDQARRLVRVVRGVVMTKNGVTR